nr:response regulator transcription factor [Phosphitispora fastidiosa]
MIADDQPLIREGISIILGSQSDIEIVAVAETGLEAVNLCDICNPDLVLMDIQMPTLSGIDALKEIKKKRPETVVLMLTTFDPDEYIYSAFQNGADGYLLKDMSGDRLIDMVRDAAAGDVLIPASIAARLIAQIPRERRRNRLTDYGLTAREQEIADYLQRGYRNDKIAKIMGISLGTAKNYISTLYSKLEVKNRQEAICLIKSFQKTT